MGPSRFDRNSDIRRGLLRTQLVKAMTQEGLQVAFPANYAGIDMFAHQPSDAGALIHAVPIQLATMSYSTFLHGFASWRTSGLLVVLLGDEREPQKVKTFAFSAEELMLVQMVGLIDERDGAERDIGAQVSALRRALDPYCMVAGDWGAKINRWTATRQMPKATLLINKCASS
jgi:hypothetical protein